MECYFTSVLKKDIFYLDEEDSNHIVKVLKHKIEDEITVIFNQDKYLVKIINLKPVVNCQIIQKLNINSEIKPKITLIMALLKEQKFDYVVQKAVELGVHKIVPIQLSRSVSVINDKNKAKAKVLRWQKIAKAAAMQSNRNIIPLVTDIVKNIDDLQQFKSESNFIAYERVSKYEKWFTDIKAINDISIVIGPEGGISHQEVEKLEKKEFKTISLGSTILRAETAPLYFLSVINYFFNFN